MRPCLVAVGTTILLGGLAIAQTPLEREAATQTPIVLGSSMTIHSEILGEDRPIEVTLPAGYERGGGAYPVVYLLDGPGHIYHATGSLRHLAQHGRALPAIIVGVGNTDRTHDLTPTTDVPQEAERFPTAGGAENFRRFLTDELRPYIDGHYRTSAGSILIGHSFGGLFAIDTALNDPGAFDAYIAISPSLWWSDQRYVHQAEEISADHPLFSRYLYIAMGGEGPTMNPPFERFVEAISRQAPSDFRLGVGRFPDEDHGSIPLLATIAGLKGYYQPMREAMDLSDISDVDQLERRFTTLSAHLGYEIRPPENAVNTLGYRLMQSGEMDSALAMFEWNASAYPDSANVYDSLGECLENMDKRSEALARYRKAVEIGTRTGDPNLAIYRKNAQRMEAPTPSGG